MSQAFCAFLEGMPTYGTKIFLEGVFIEEVRVIRMVPGKLVYLTSNWIPTADGQDHLVQLFISQEKAALSINLPAGYGTKAFQVAVEDVDIILEAGQPATLYAKFKILDPADDGPEVRVIKAHEDGFIRSVMQAIGDWPSNSHTYHYTSAAVCVESAGGGFTVVHSAIPETYIASPDEEAATRDRSA